MYIHNKKLNWAAVLKASSVHENVNCEDNLLCYPLGNNGQWLGSVQKQTQPQEFGHGHIQYSLSSQDKV
jgi:hypothetical protein